MDVDITDKIDEALDPDTISMLKNLQNIIGSTVNKESIKAVIFAMAQVYDADKKMVIQTLKNLTGKGK